MNVKTVTSGDFRRDMKGLMDEVYNGDTTILVTKHKKVMFMCVPPGSELCQCGHSDVTEDLDGESDASQFDSDDVVTAVETPTAPSRPGKIIEK